MKRFRQSNLGHIVSDMCIDNQILLLLFEFQDTMMMGADYYQTESEIASLLAEGNVPIGVGRNTKIRYPLKKLTHQLEVLPPPLHA